MPMITMFCIFNFLNKKQKLLHKEDRIYKKYISHDKSLSVQRQVKNRYWTLGLNWENMKQLLDKNTVNVQENLWQCLGIFMLIAEQSKGISLLKPYQHSKL